MTRVGKVLRWQATGALIALALFSFSLSPAHADSRPITIGGTLGLTGPFAGPAAEYKAIYGYWLNEVNKGGGLLGRPVKMTIYNDEGTPTVAQTLYNRLIEQDHVDLLLAPFATFVGGAIVPIVLSHHMVLFNGGFVGINIFRAAKGSIIGSYTYQEPDYTRGLFDLIKKPPAQQRPKTVAVFTAQSAFPLVVRDGAGGAGGALNYAKQAGLRVFLNEQYPPNTTDFAGLVQKAKAAHADILLELGLPDDSLQVVRTVAQQGYKPSILCVCGAQVSTLPAWSKMGAAADSVIGTTVSWPNEHFNGFDKIAAFFKSRGYQTVPTYGIVSYAILQVLQQAVDGAKTLDQDKLKSYVLSHEFHTAAGNFKYRADGTPEFSQVVIQYLHDKNQVIWPAQFATSKAQIPMR